MTNRVTILKDKFNQSLGLPFKELLPESVIGETLWELKIKYKRRLFDPFVTLWAFLSQVLDTALCATNWYSSSSEKNSFGVAGLSIRGLLVTTVVLLPKYFSVKTS